MTKKKGKRASGEGSITKRKDGRYQVAVSYYDPKTNRKRRKFAYGKTEREALEKKRAIENTLESGGVVNPASVTVEDWLDVWLKDYMKTTLRPTTWASYDVQVKHHLVPAIGHLKLRQLQTSHLQRLYNSKLEQGRADGKAGGLSVASVRYIHKVIHGALDQARRESMINSNPADNVRLPKGKAPEVKHLDGDQVRGLLQEAQNSRHFAAYFVAVSTGIRRGELLALKWEDVDLEARIITVKRNLVTVGGMRVFQEPKTHNSARTIELTTVMVEALKQRRKEYREERLRAGSAWIKHDLVFGNPLGEPYDPSSFSAGFRRCAERAGLDGVSLHALRHTFATLSLERGVGIKEVQADLGHAEPGFTLKVYSGVTGRMRTDATEKRNQLFQDLLSK